MNVLLLSLFTHVDTSKEQNLPIFILYKRQIPTAIKLVTIHVRIDCKKSAVMKVHKII